MSMEGVIAILMTMTGSMIVACGILIRMYLVEGKSDTHKRIDGVADRVLSLEMWRVEENEQREEIIDLLGKLEKHVG